MQIVQLSSHDEQKDNDKIILTGCNTPQYLQLCNTVFNKPFESIFETILPHKRFTRRNFIIFYCLFGIPTAVVSYFNNYWLLLMPFAVLLALGMAKLLTKRRSYMIGNENVYVNGGLFAQTQAITKIKHIQAIKLSQTYFQRKTGVASLRLYVAGDVLFINYIDKATAIAIKDNLLYHCE